MSAAEERAEERAGAADPLPGANVASAYRCCEQITKTEARNFSYGIRLLPAGKRRALSAVYATARRIDDIGDGTLPPQKKLDLLARVREEIRAAADGSRWPAGDPVIIALMHAARVYPIPLSAFDELIDGCEADVRGATYTTFAELEHYCRCVAGAVGRLSLSIFGLARQPAAGDDPSRLADTLGIALQLTNILRDIREDREGGRVYLPREDLDAYGCTLTLDESGEFSDDADRLAALIRFEAERAETWYAEGLRLLPLLDRRSAGCTGAMAGIYHRLLHQIAADPLAVTRTRVRLSGGQKARVAVRALVRSRA